MTAADMAEGGISIKSWASDDRPREKLMLHGADTLSNAELLAILIGSGVPGTSAVELMRRVLADHGDSLQRLGRLSCGELTRYKGLGEAKAVKILAACTLAGRRMSEEYGRPERMASPEDAFRHFRPRMQDLTVEECHLLMLDNALHIKGSVMLSHGGLTGASVDVRELLRHALLSQAAAVVLCHNHPSGNTAPSADDDRLTGHVGQACRAVGLRLLDHIIIGNGKYYSYSDNGKL